MNVSDAIRSQVEGMFYVNETLKEMIFEELRQSGQRGDGGFLPAVKQVANVAALPGIVKVLLPLLSLDSRLILRSSTASVEVIRSSGHSLWIRIRHRKRGCLRPE